MNKSLQQRKIGVLGGGQLGRMLFQDAISLDLSIHFLDPDASAPCSSIARNFSQGNFKDFEPVYHFGKDKDIITIEIEHVNLEALKKLETEGVKVFPQPGVLEIIQDKGLQKEFYTRHNIPTAPFYLVENKTEALTYSAEFPFMQKLRKGGYDGRGVTPLRNERDAEKAFDEPSVLEKFVDFEKELSVIVARNEKGEVAHFPVVEQEFNAEANLVEFLVTPARISAETEQKAIEIVRKVIEKLEMVGLLAVELFLTPTGEILVNEMAPRPHNSGHHTIEACATSQFEQHLRSICNLPLGSTSWLKPAVMINLLGEKGHEGNVHYQGMDDALEIEGVYPHIYGKKITKPFRKMGHITVIGETIEDAIDKAKKIQNQVKVIAQ
ncbi:MAG: 5-(carboxyamino)imidazole ribonucleotide synthase [Flavobacteriales bacterium]